MKLTHCLSSHKAHVRHRPPNHIEAGDPRRTHRNLRPLVTAILVLSTVITTDIVFAQEEAAIVVLGRVLKTNASDEPLVPSSSRTAIISVQKMYAGSEIAGDLTGHIATVILSRAEAVKEGEVALFAGNPRFLGKSLTIAVEAEIPSQGASPSALAAVERGTQARRDKPVLDRLAVASMVFRGSVETVRPLAPETAAEQGKRAPAPPTEHDPEWHIATVRVTTPLRGGEVGQIVTVVFPASQDVIWFNAPKLKAGQDAVFIAHAPNKQEEPMYRASGLAQFLEKQPVYLVTEPFDVLPLAEEARVRGLLGAAKETK